MGNEYLGRTVRDEISGFEGIVVGHVVYLTGCHQLLVQPKCKSGEFVESRWFDVDRCLLAYPNEEPVKLPSTQNGFDAPAPRR